MSAIAADRHRAEAACLPQLPWLWGKDAATSSREWWCWRA